MHEIVISIHVYFQTIEDTKYVPIVDANARMKKGPTFRHFESGAICVFEMVDRSGAIYYTTD